MKRLLVAMAAAAVFLAGSAQAQYGDHGFGKLLPPRNANMGYKDGLAVLQLCTADVQTELLECLGFLEGVSDMFVAVQQAFIAYMIAHPERRPEQGATLVKQAIQARWCAH